MSKYSGNDIITEYTEALVKERLTNSGLNSSSPWKSASFDFASLGTNGDSCRRVYACLPRWR